MKISIFSHYKPWQKYLIFFLLAVILFQNIFIALTHSVHYDEMCYIGAGKYVFDTKNIKYNAFLYHPPLSFYLNSILLLPLSFDEEIYQSDNCEKVGNNILFHSNYSPYLLAFLARLPFIILSLIFSLVVLKFAEDLYGVKSALFAIFLYTFSVIILSRSNVALTDFIVAFFIFTTIYYFWKFMKQQKKKDLSLTGIFLGLALLSKATALILIPSIILIALFEIYRTYRKHKVYKKDFLAKLKSMSIIFLLGTLVLWAGYGFSFHPLKESFPDYYANRVYEEIDKSFPDSLLKENVLIVFEKLPLPFPSYFSTISLVIFHSKEGRERFFFGEIIKGRILHYPIVVFLLKTQISLIFFIIIGFIFFRRKRDEAPANEIYLFIPVILIFLLFMFNKMTSSIDHLLPIYPFLFVFVSKTINLKNKFYKMFLGILIFHYLISSLIIFPHPWTYFNELAGGPSNGYKYLGGGNVDNGQHLMALKDFMTLNHIDKINFSYLGSVDPKDYGINYDYLPSPYFQYWVPNGNLNLLPKNWSEDCSKRTGWVAISVGNFQHTYLQNKTCFFWLEDYEPVKKVGNTIFVYNIKS